MCRKGLHALEGDNVGVHPVTGRRFCRDCRRLRERGTTCPKGHELSGSNVKITPTGQRRCVTCAAHRRLVNAKAKPAKRPVAVEVEPEPTVEIIPRGKAPSPFAGGLGPTGALYRHALRVRGRF
jgi:hypothetical protein